MRFTELVSACLIVFLFSAGSTAVGSSHMGNVPRITRPANALQTISNLASDRALQKVTADRTRVMQHVPVKIVPSEQGEIGRQWQGFHLQSSLPSDAPSGIVSPNALPPAVWDEQLGTSFTQDFTSLAYNVTAVEQADVDGYGPAYLLNGLSGSGYWYQVGLSWDWPNVAGGYVSGFHLNYEVFNSRGSSIFPRSGGGGLDDFVGTVNAGDTVLLSLYFSGGNVIMYGYDFNTSASAQESYSAVGASRFVGTPHSVANSNGLFTGLMTEWYHAFEYFGDEASVLFINPTVALSSAWMWMGEFDPDNGTSLFSASTPSPVSYSNPTQLNYFSSNNATEASNAYSFITGTAKLVPIILSYSIVGGGTGHGPPALTYFFGGTQYDTTLTTSPTTYYADSDSVWNASNPLTGSSSTEIWSSNETTTGVASSPQTIDIVYYHRYLVNLGYTVSGAGAGYSPPNVTIEQFGDTFVVVPPASVFIDVGSQCVYQNPLFGSNSTTRLESPLNGTITVLSSTNTSLTYFLQYGFTASYSVSGGSGYTSPSLFGTQFGLAYAPALSANPATYWLDSGTSWSFDNVLAGPENSERWIITTTASGTVDSPSTLSPTYLHQYGLRAYVSIVGSNSGYFFPQFDFVDDGSDESITLSGSPQTAWADEGIVWSISPNPSAGSNSSVRWDTQDILSGTISAASTVNPTYYHQYAVAASYSVSEGGNPPAPTITSKLFGKADSFSVPISPTTYWLDEGASWTLTNPLGGSSASERWFANESSASGTVSSSTVFSFVFIHQFYVDIGSEADVGSTTPESGWFSAGEQIQISAVAESSWQFENWDGSGTGSYTGALNAANVTVNSSIVENATFYPGLTINASSFGAVTYSYRSESGSVPAGSSRILYVPLNASVSLTASPSFYVFQFIRWSGAVNSTAQQVMVTVAAPMMLQANFDYDQSNVIITIEVVASALGVLVISLSSKKRRAAGSHEGQQEGAGETVPS